MKTIAATVAVIVTVGVAPAGAEYISGKVDPATVFSCTHRVYEDGSTVHVDAPGKRAPMDNMPWKCRQLVLDYVNETNHNDKPRPHRKQR